MEEQILGDAKDILESVDDYKEKVTNAKQRLKQEKANNENLTLAIIELKTLNALKLADLASNEFFIDKEQSSNIHFMNEARQTYSICQDLHPRSTSQENKLGEALNGLKKTEANFAQAQSKVDKLIKSLEQEYENLCHEEEKKKENFNNNAIISEEQKEHDMLASIQKIESEANNFEMERRTLELMVLQSLTKFDELEAKLFTKKENNNEINVEIKFIEEYCSVDEKSIEKLTVEITDLEEKLTEIQTKTNTLNEYNSLLSGKPQEDLDELAKVKQQTLEAMKTTKSEKKQKYKELLEKNQTALKLAELQCSDLEAAINKFKQKTEKSENLLAELKTEEDKLITENALSLGTLKKHEQEIKSEKQILKKLMKIEKSRHIFTKPNTLQATPIGKTESVIALSKKNTGNWDSDGSMDADYNAFIQKNKKLKRYNK